MGVKNDNKKCILYGLGYIDKSAKNKCAKNKSAKNKSDNEKEKETRQKLIDPTPSDDSIN